MSETLKSSIVLVGGFRPTNSPEASHFGLRPLAHPHEDWPRHNGDAMLFVCQLNLTTAPVVPKTLDSLHLITFFVEPECSDLGHENGEGWCLRAYSAIDGLVALAAPPGVAAVKRGFECRWQESADYPTDADAASRTKIGGRSSDIQSEPWWELEAHPADPQFCLQIDSEEKVGLMWGDSGTLYLARGAAPGCQDRWFLDWQCY